MPARRKPSRSVAHRKPKVPEENVEIGDAKLIEKAACCRIFVKRVRADGEWAELKRTTKARDSATGKEQKPRERRNGYRY